MLIGETIQPFLCLQYAAASLSARSAESWGMPNVRLIKHEAVQECGPYEVRINGLRSRFFYWAIVHPDACDPNR